LVGFKYIAEAMNKLEAEGRIDEFLVGGEESNGIVVGDYIRDKDSCSAAIIIGELVSREKDKGNTLRQYLDSLQEQVGVYYNYLSEIRLLGAEGMSNIARIQSSFRANLPKMIGAFEVESVIDRQQGAPFVSTTDKVMRDVLVFHFKSPAASIKSINVSIRPSGTEPKTKMYFEVAMNIDPQRTIAEIKAEAADWCNKLEKTFMTFTYKIIGYDFPERGFLLFWQIPGPDKMKYFEIEDQISALTNVPDALERQELLLNLLKFLGANPIEKVDKAFTARFGKDIRSFLNL
jgi:phosphoglucomutase